MVHCRREMSGVLSTECACGRLMRVESSPTPTIQLNPLRLCVKELYGATMTSTSEVDAFLRRHLDSVFANDVAEYHATTTEDLTLYE